MVVGYLHGLYSTFVQISSIMVLFKIVQNLINLFLALDAYPFEWRGFLLISRVHEAVYFTWICLSCINQPLQLNLDQWRIYIVKFWTRPPGSKFFQFHAVFGKIWQNRMLAPPPRELAPPPRGNPGSATVDKSNYE